MSGRAPSQTGVALLFLPRAWPFPAPSLRRNRAETRLRFFKSRVRPFRFRVKRPDHARLLRPVMSRATTHSACKAFTPGSDAWTEEQSRRNFEVVSILSTTPRSRYSPADAHPLGPEGAAMCFSLRRAAVPVERESAWRTLAAWLRSDSIASGMKCS